MQDLDPTRRSLLLGAAAGLVAGAAPPPAGASRAAADLDRMTGLELAALVRRRRISPDELLEHAIRRIESVNPRINAVTLRHFDEARAQVRAGIDLAAPFAGVPFLLKDLWTDLAGTITTNGSRLYAHSQATVDAELVRRCRRAGLVIIGKSATPELGLSPTTESILHGPTRNPWDPQRSAGGSSGGAAAAVAARSVPLAHATDGGGSIRIPASCCGLFGLKPTRARTPVGPRRMEGWSGLSCGHAVTVSVADSAALLDVVAGIEPGAPYSAPPHGSFLAATRARPRRLRVALQRRPLAGTPVDPVCLAAVDDAARLCAELGHKLEEAAPPLEAARLSQAFGTLISVALRVALDDQATALGRPWTGDDVEPVTAILAGYGGTIDGVTHARARATCDLAGRTMAGFLSDYDLILSPTLAQAPPPLGLLAQASSDFDGWARRSAQFSPFTSLANMTGQPAMSVPLFWSDAGLPIGVQFAARHGAEETLFTLAAQLEEARPWRDRLPPLAR